MSFGEPFQGLLKLRLNRGNKARWGSFGIPSRTLFDVVGKRLELRKMYQIDGQIEGVGPFSISHVEKGSRIVHISVRRDQAGGLHYGSFYSVRVTSVNERLAQNIIDSSDGPESRYRLGHSGQWNSPEKDGTKGRKWFWRFA